MNELFLSMREVWEQYIWQPIASFNLWDALDILLLTAVLYGLYLFIKGRRAGKLAIGLALLLIFYAISDIAGLRAIHQLLEGIAPFAIVLLAVVFQPELRDALEKLGSSPLSFLSAGKENRADLAHTVSEVVEAACQIATTDKDGALIVIERSTPLGDYVAKGQSLDAAVSGNLLRNIFVDRAPLHDGAVIIRNNRIAAACSKLPLSNNEEVVRGMGTRHRAAVGITEVSDCVVVVVSEEKHIISIANNGFIKRDYNRSVTDLQNESTLKNVQNDLRKDLFLLLAGMPIEDEAGSESRRLRKFALHVRFKWTLKEASEKKTDHLKKRREAANGRRSKPISAPDHTELFDSEEVEEVSPASADTHTPTDAS